MAIRTQIPLVALDRQHRAMGSELNEAISGVISRCGFTLGPEVEAFEEEFASLCQARYAVGVGTGTDALHFALRACGIGPGDEVVTAVNTFAATAEAIVMAGARSVFVDIEEDTFLMDVSRLENAISPKTKAVIPVHLYGQPVAMDDLWAVAQKYNLKVVEDACQAHGATFSGHAVGGLGDAGCFSFYPSKNLGAMGDGGAVVTNSPEIAERVRLLRNHGENEERLHLEAGYCSRLHGLQAAILRAKLRHLTGWNSLRIEAAAQYGRALAASNVLTPIARSDVEHVYHLYVVRSNDRETIRQRLAEEGIGTGIHYAVPLHLEPAFSFLGYEKGDFPVAERQAGQILSLPMYPYLAKSEIEVIAGAIEKCAK